MQIIELETRIAAPAMRVFLLSLNVDLHKASTAGTQEEAVAGVTHGLFPQKHRVQYAKFPQVALLLCAHCCSTRRRRRPFRVTGAFSTSTTQPASFQTDWPGTKKQTL